MPKKLDSIAFPLSLYLTQIRGRLENDVAPYFRLIHQISDKTMRENGIPTIIGNWATLRMTLPPIYAIAKAQPDITLEEADGRERELVCGLLAELGVPFPYTFIEMYRHSLMHNDAPRGVKLGDKRASWSLSIGVGKHFSTGGVIHIDTEKLFDDLLELLDRKIIDAEAYKTVVAMPTDVDFTGVNAGEISAEFSQMR